MSNGARHRGVVTGTVLAFASGLGILFNSLGSAQSGLITSILFGNILASTTEQVITFAIIALLVLGLLSAPLSFVIVAIACVFWVALPTISRLRAKRSNQQPSATASSPTVPDAIVG